MSIRAGALDALALVILNVTLPPAIARAQTGLVPINDLGPGTYAGFQGGLYPGGVNTPPSGHLSDALTRAAQIIPRNAAGAADPNGWIGMIAVGMSNTTHEFAAFERNEDADASRNAHVVIVDTGFGGQTASIIANPNAGYWTTMAQRLTAMGLTAAQVQVAWLKEAEAQPPNNFPLHAQALRDTLKKVVRNLHDKFPNLKICYVSSRIYGGYAAQGSLNPEPQAYESGFSVKWLIQDQMDGDPNLNYGQLPGPVHAPLLLWGAYLWADGPTPRSDGLTWLVSDLESDHTHPSFSGEQKVAGLLTNFFGADPTAAPWWPQVGDETLVTFDALEDAHVAASSPSSNFGAAPLLLVQGGASPINVYTRFDVSSESRTVQLAKLSLRVGEVGGGTLRQVTDTSWDESTITYNSAPPMGANLLLLPQSSRDGTISANVTANLLSDADHKVSYALTTTATGQGNYVSKEGGQPPRLVLVVQTATSAVPGEKPAPSRLEATPNPFLADARVRFDLATATDVRLLVFSVRGDLIRRLFTGVREAGAHEVVWDGRDDSGHEVPAGLYFLRLEAGDASREVKLIRMR